MIHQCSPKESYQLDPMLNSILASFVKNPYYKLYLTEHIALNLQLIKLSASHLEFFGVAKTGENLYNFVQIH